MRRARPDAVADAPRGEIAFASAAARLIDQGVAAETALARTRPMRGLPEASDAETRAAEVTELRPRYRDWLERERGQICTASIPPICRDVPEDGPQPVPMPEPPDDDIDPGFTLKPEPGDDDIDPGFHARPEPGDDVDPGFTPPERRPRPVPLPEPARRMPDDRGDADDSMLGDGRPSAAAADKFEVTPNLLDAFARSFEDWFFRTGDASLARGLAIQDLQLEDAGRGEQPRGQTLEYKLTNEFGRPVDPTAGGAPMVHRPGWVWENGFWRPAVGGPGTEGWNPFSGKTQTMEGYHGGDDEDDGGDEKERGDDPGGDDGGDDDADGDDHGADDGENGTDNGADDDGGDDGPDTGDDDNSGGDEDPGADLAPTEPSEPPSAAPDGGNIDRLGPDARDEPWAGVYNIDPKPPEALAPDLIEAIKGNDLDPRWMDEIANRETGGQPHDGWGTVRTDAKGNEALGRFQMTKPALQDAGLMDEKGDWTGKYGVNSKEDFLNNPEAQRATLRDYTARNDQRLETSGAKGHITQKIAGIKGEITVTDGGLHAAAHRQGARTVGQYLDHLQAHGWKSDPTTFPNKFHDRFLSVETKLREFQGVPRLKR